MRPLDAAPRQYIYSDDLLGGDVIGCIDGDYKIILTERENVKYIIINNHYSKTLPKNSKYHFLVEYKGIVEGALSLGYGIRPKIKTSWGDIDSDRVLEFDRMWLSDVPPKNSESKVIGMLVKVIKQLSPTTRWLISYADGTVGNTGTIYKATNFRELPSLKADFYILADGTRVHPVSMYHRHKTRAWATMQKIYPGIKKAEGRQYRFILPLHRSAK